MMEISHHYITSDLISLPWMLAVFQKTSKFLLAVFFLLFEKDSAFVFMFSGIYDIRKWSLIGPYYSLHILYYRVTSNMYRHNIISVSYFFIFWNDRINDSASLNVRFNDSYIHAIPIMVNLLSNAILRYVLDTFVICIWIKSFLLPWKVHIFVVSFCILYLCCIHYVIQFKKNQYMTCLILHGKERFGSR